MSDLHEHEELTLISYTLDSLLAKGIICDNQKVRCFLPVSG